MKKRSKKHVTKREYESIKRRKQSVRRSETSDNRVICPKTGRAKYLYPTLKKALLACKYSDNPQRPYYCNRCFGYHTTSETKDEYYDNLERQFGHKVERSDKANTMTGLI